MSFKVKLIAFVILSLIVAMGYFTIFPYIPDEKMETQNIEPSHIIQDL